MKVLLLEDNLMWSVRTRKGLESLGHTVLVAAETAEMPYVDLAIVNLSARAFDPFDAVRRLKQGNTRVIGHVGHKDKELWRQGEESGCDRVVSNGTLANRLKAVLDDASR
jgi:CheY-like chemotaxis protein